MGGWIGLDWIGWISPGGVKYRAPYGAKNVNNWNHDPGFGIDSWCILGTKADDWSNCKFPIQCFIYPPACEPHIYTSQGDQPGNEDRGLRGRGRNWSFSIWRISQIQICICGIPPSKRLTCLFFTDSLSLASLAKWPCIVVHAHQNCIILHHLQRAGIVAWKDNLYL